MEEELSLLKKSLRSLVVSSATTMTVTRLLKDYRNLVGGTLPVAKYGYKDPVHFLRERCTDIFLMEGPHWDPILTPKVTKNLAHIDQMVQRQKVQSSSRHIGKRRSVFQPTLPEPRPITRNGPPKRCNAPNNYNTKPLVQRQADTVTPIQEVKPRTQDVKPKVHYIKENNCMQTNNNSCNNERENIDSNSVECHPSRQQALSQFYKKRLPQYNSDMDFPSPDLENNFKGSAESGRQSSTSSTSKQALLDELKAEILTIIEDADDGVWCTDLIKLYKDRYGRELQSNRFGHTSVVWLVHSMQDRISITRPQPNGDWLLQDPRRAAAPAPCGAHVHVQAPAPRASAPAPEPEDALPGVDFEPDVFPDDCLHYLEGIASVPLDSLVPGAQLEVLIGEVYSPSHFWMLRVGPEYNLAMEALMDKMTEYYVGAGAGAGRVLARGAVRAGQYCASLYDRDWHRALIVSVVDSDTVKVRHVDYGTVDTVPVSGLKPLCRAFSVLPAQAIRGRLAACRPAAAGWRWPRAACTWLLDRVRERRLYANILHVDREEDIVETFLIDTSGEDDVCLSRDLIRVGHADLRTDSALQGEDCYLYPRFEALERGATPNYADICRMLADGIALEYVDSYRRHVPGPWARRERLHPPPPPAATRCERLHPPSPPAATRCELLHPPPPPPATRCELLHSPPPPPADAALELINRVPLLRIEDPRAQPPRSPPPLHEAEPALCWPCVLPAQAQAPAPAQYAGLEVRLSETEWAVLAHLRGADAAAAQWYALAAAWRALLPPPPGL